MAAPANERAATAEAVATDEPQTLVAAIYRPAIVDAKKARPTSAGCGNGPGVRKIISATPARTVVAANFLNFKTPTTVTYELIRESDGWKIDDIKGAVDT